MSEDVVVDDEMSDFLLAKIVDKIENETENDYERSRGKNYRAIKKSNEKPKLDSNDITKTKNGALLRKEDAYLYSTSSNTSITSVSSNENEDFEINTELIAFISKKKDFIMKLVSDPSCSLEYHDRSERLIALHNCSSLKTFEENALEEYSNICSQMKDYIGTGGYPYEPYISHIYTKILTIEKKRDPDDICDYGGYRIVPIKMKKKNMMIYIKQ